MSRFTIIQLAAVLLLGAGLGYMTASGKLSSLANSAFRDSTGSEAAVDPPRACCDILIPERRCCDPVSPSRPCCAEGAAETPNPAVEK